MMKRGGMVVAFGNGSHWAFTFGRISWLYGINEKLLLVFDAFTIHIFASNHLPSDCRALVP
jgi:hypothetical protein